MRKNASRVFIDLFKLQRSRFRNLKSIDRWQDEMDVMSYERNIFVLDQDISLKSLAISYYFEHKLHW